MLCWIALWFLLRNQTEIQKPLDKIITVFIYLLLFMLGVWVGINETIINNIGTIGINAAILTLGAVIGSILCAYFLYMFFFKKNDR